jgi:hypothetical protein
VQNFKLEPPEIKGNVAKFQADGDSCRVTVIVERKDRKEISEQDARLAYTKALALFPKLTTVGKV